MSRTVDPISLRIAQEGECDVCGTRMPAGWWVIQFNSGKLACTRACYERATDEKESLRELLIEAHNLRREARMLREEADHLDSEAGELEEKARNMKIRIAESKNLFHAGRVA